MNTKQKVKQKNTFPLVGIGASAGGLKAFTQLLEAIPPDIGMAFILVQHLDPTTKSLLPETLSRTTPLPFIEVTDGTKITKNHIYAMPSESYMTIIDKTLHLTPRKKLYYPHKPIDSFFQSLAKHHGKDAIGVVLSGTGDDGTVGIRAIKESGGRTFAQDDSAQYNNMPQSAIDSGSVDFILSPDEIARTLFQISHNPVNDNHKPKAEENSTIDVILAILQTKTGMDLRQYRETSVNRRIQRRMFLNHIETVKEYAMFLGKNPQEIKALRKDMLIHVTSFFREPEQFEILKKSVFPTLFKNRSTQKPVNVWIPGCATGEEAYSFAILFQEFLGKIAHRIPVKILATDIEKDTIAAAKKGTYKENITERVSPVRIAEFFTKVKNGYKVKKSIRDMCEFAVADVTQKPPRLDNDFVICRNVLIYFGKSLQQNTLFILSSALKPGGFLLLGKSEGLGVSAEFFSPIDSKRKIYSKNDIASAAYDLRKTINAQVGVSTTPLSSKKTVVLQPEDFKHTDRQQKIIKLKEAVTLTQEYANEIISELDVMNEDLQSANEELTTTNEELQTTNEELQTSEEELQTANEEMTTLNEELQTRNEEAIRARDYADAIIKTVRESIVILDSHLRVKSANNSFYKTFNVLPKDIYNMVIYDLGDRQWNIPKLRTLLEKILPQKSMMEDFVVEHDFETIGHRIMLLNARLLSQGPDKKPLILLSIEDITDRNELDKQKDVLIGIASHELKTPLTTIKGYIDIIAKQLAKDKQIKYLRYVSKMDYQVIRVTALVNELLDVSRIQTGKLELHKEDLGIDNLVKDIVEDMKQTYADYQIIFEGKTNGAVVYADKYRLSQVLVNLISNAIKYSPENKKVIIRTSTAKKDVMVSVQDFGIGISKHDQVRIFERFFQARTHIRVSAFGLGLGLYISKEIIDRHHGKIWLESVKGHGTTFFFKLPMKENKNHE